jgi:lysophospholipase L1-like esterase
MTAIFAFAGPLSEHRRSLALLAVSTREERGHVHANALLVVAKITPTQSDATNTKVRSYNDAIPGVVQARTSARKHIIVVDMYAALSANARYKTAWLDDSLHPNDAGYVALGETWYTGIKPYLR